MMRTCLHIYYDTTTADYKQTLLKTVDDEQVVELKEDIRERPASVFAILSSYPTLSFLFCGTCNRKDINGKSHSIAFWSPSRQYYDGYHPHEYLYDYYRPGTQSGHLIAESCGGPRCCKNLVPMRTEVNLSQWKTKFESALAKESGFSICNITCTYNDNMDPRIPTDIDGKSIDFDLSDIFTDSAIQNGKDALISLVHQWLLTNKKPLREQFASYYAAPQSLCTTLRTALQGVVPTDTVKSQLLPASSKTNHGTITQSVIIPKAPAVTVHANKLWALLDKYYQKNLAIEATGLMNLNAFPAKMVQKFKKAKNLKKDKVYALPPRGRRPYEILDYLALTGLLDKCVETSAGNFVSIDTTYLMKNLAKDEFTQEMKALIIVTNQWLLRRREAHLWNTENYNVDWASLQGNIYRSDAKDFGDPGDIGDGIVLDPQIDHIVPVSPKAGPPKRKPSTRQKRYKPYRAPFSIPLSPAGEWGIHRGPSIFSNAQLTSTQFNNKKSNKIYIDNMSIVYAEDLPEAYDDESDGYEEEYLITAKSGARSEVDKFFGAPRKKVKKD